MPESLFNKVAGLRPTTLLKKRLWHSCCLRPTTLLKKRLAQVLSCEFCEIFKNTFSYRTPLVAAFLCWSFEEKPFKEYRPLFWSNLVKLIIQENLRTLYALGIYI